LLLERRITNAFLWLGFVVALALFSTMLFSQKNTFSIVEPIVRWFVPTASPETLAAVHNVVRKMGHFFIPTVAFWLLVLGPLRNRPVTALLVCIAFACLDEGLQNFSPNRNGSILDVMLDTIGALFGFFVHGAIKGWRATRPTTDVLPMRRAAVSSVDCRSVAAKTSAGSSVRTRRPF
jgi:VanZ family protein